MLTHRNSIVTNDFATRSLGREGYRAQPLKAVGHGVVGIPFAVRGADEQILGFR